jgi:endonuclease-8
VPEGPEIRREARALGRVLVGATLARLEYRVPRLAAKARRLRGARIVSATSRGKALLLAWDAGLVHYSHNQLYGEWRVVPVRRLPALLEPRQASVRVILATTTHAAVLLSATDIDLLSERQLAAQPYLARLGPDVLDRTTTVPVVLARLADPMFARRSLASLLLDQSFVAGPGNYLRSEILHAARLHPARRPVDLDAAARRAVAHATLALPRQSLATGGVTNDLALARRLRSAGAPFDEYRFRVYAREALPCRTCGTPIRRVEASRAVYFCPRCQSNPD